MHDPIQRYDMVVIRGDSFAQDIGLGDGFDEVATAPEDYSVRMVIRAAQDDDMPVLLELATTPEVADPDDTNEVLAYAHFGATEAQTTALPPYDLVYFVELIALDGSSRTRLYQGKIDIRD